MERQRLARREDLRVERFEDGTIVFDPKSAAVHHLDGPATIVWDRLAPSATLEELLDIISGELGAPRDVVSQELEQVLETLLDRELVVSHESPP